MRKCIPFQKWDARRSEAKNEMGRMRNYWYELFIFVVDPSPLGRALRVTVARVHLQWITWSLFAIYVGDETIYVCVCGMLWAVVAWVLVYAEMWTHLVRSSTEHLKICEKCKWWLTGKYWRSGQYYGQHILFFAIRKFGGRMRWPENVLQTVCRM